MQKIKISPSIKNLRNKLGANLTGNRRGSLTFSGALSISGILALTLLLSLNLKKQLENLKYRAKIYLCYHSQEKYIKSLTSRMEKSNTAIAALYIAANTPNPLAPKSKILLDVTVKSQSMMFHFMKASFLKSKHCDALEKAKVLKNIPYKETFLGLTRSPMKTAIRRKKKWKRIIGIPGKSNFVLYLKYQMKNGSLKSKAHEIGPTASPFLKHLFAVLF